MKGAFLFLALALLVAGVTLVRRRLRRHRRETVRTRPFPSPWRTILQQNLPLYRRLPDGLKEQLHGYINLFIAEKSFEGLAGLDVTDEMKVTIAGQACLLLLNREMEVYPKLYSILLYPAAYRTREPSLFPADADEEPPEVRLGESWTTGSVVLAWDHIRHGARDPKDGQNLVLHEFAHQLDQEDNRSDGAPILGERSDYVPWARVLSHEYERLRRRAARGRKSVLDDYGATDPAEFFAVATEAFFEKPKQMKRVHPELYRELKNYYKVDPAEWV